MGVVCYFLDIALLKWHRRIESFSEEKNNNDNNYLSYHTRAMADCGAWRKIAPLISYDNPPA